MDWRKIRDEYETSDITVKALAEKHDIKLGTLKSRKSRERWSRNATKKDATQKKKVATHNEDILQPNIKTVESLVESDELNDKQRLFCMYYLKYFNATKAYQKSYECKYESAKAHGYKLLQSVAVKKEIDRMKEEQFNGLGIDARFVLQKYIDIAFADITDFTLFGRKTGTEKVKVGEDDEGMPIYKEQEYSYNYVEFKNYDEVDGTIVTEVKQGKDGISVKLADKMKALDFLSKYTDLLSENEQKKLKEEKTKTEIAKTRAEINKLEKTGDGTQEKDVAAALRGLVDGINSKAD